MSNAAYENFLGLTGGTPPDDLDDGEAATIAHAMDACAVAVIDERKAVRVAAKLFPKLPILTSMDLFSATELVNAIGQNKLSEIVFSALRNSRMRIPQAFSGMDCRSSRSEPYIRMQESRIIFHSSGN